MAGPQGVQYALVNSGDTVSAVVSLLNNPRFIGLWVPAGVDSHGTGIRLQGAPTNTASLFGRLRDPFTGSSQWSLFQTNPSSLPIGADVTAVVEGFSYFRVELPVAQTDNRTLAINVKV